MDENLRQLVVAARERYEKLSPTEKMSMFARQSIGYVTAETFLGVIEDRGDFEQKKSTALGALGWLLEVLEGRADEVHSHSAFLAKVWLLTPSDREMVKADIIKTIEDLRVLDKSEERAVRFI